MVHLTRCAFRIGFGAARTGRGVVAATLFGVATAVSAQRPEPWIDPSPHTVQFVTVEENVRLEVLDWGGAGRPIILLTGLGNTAHVFDDFAPKLAGTYHVFGVTRRGYGNSSAPMTGYGADRLADDVLAVIDALKISRAVLVGHSIAGQELSSLGARHADRVDGLVYLDAASDRTNSTSRASIARRLPPPEPSTVDLDSVRALQTWMTRALGFTLPESEMRQTFLVTSAGRLTGFRTPARVPQAIGAGTQKPDYASIRAPALAFFAFPRSARELPGYKEDNAAVRSAAEELFTSMVSREAANVQSFRTGVATGHVVELPGANHYVFVTNEADVLRELRAFLAGLP